MTSFFVRNALTLSLFFITSGTARLPSGNQECPCIDSTPILAKQSNCVRSDGSNGVLFPDGTCASLSYGGDGCAPYDMTEEATCIASGENQTIPAFCSRSFCFVDPDKCRLSTEHFYESRLPHVHYSYSTCGFSASAWLEYKTTGVLSNKDIVVVLPFVEYPFHYKRDSKQKPYAVDSPEASDDSLPWHGIVVDYFKAVAALSNIKSIEFVHRSKGSLDRGHKSPYTQAVSDVQVGVADVAISTFWVTAERLGMTSFTAPMTVDEFTLWIPQPDFGTDGLGDSVEKILMPFSKELWIATILVILAFTIFSVVVSPEQLREFGEEPNTLKEKVQRVAIVFTDSLNISMLEFLGGEVNYSNEVNYSQKLLNFSFAFFIFITVSAYTANLAAFLTISGATNYLSSMEQAIAKNIGICALYGVKDDLEALYPDANWVFHLHSNEMFEAYDNGDCEAFVMGWVETRASADYQGWICERQLVRVRRPVMEKMMAFPVDKDLAAGLSHWIVYAQSLGISFDAYISQEEAQCHLDITISNAGDEDAATQQLTASNLTLPLVLFGITFALALLIHFTKRMRRTINNSDHIRKEEGSSADTYDEDLRPATGALLVKPQPGQSTDEFLTLLHVQQQTVLKDCQQNEALLHRLACLACGQDLAVDN